MPRLNGNIGEGAAHQSYPPAQYNGFHTAYSIEPERENLVYSKPKKKKKMISGASTRQSQSSTQEPDLRRGASTQTQGAEVGQMACCEVGT
jgi:hypothetical protein